MKLQVGDKVRYLNDVGGGEITKILGANLVEISDELGFTIPVQESELLLIERPVTQQNTQTAPTNPFVANPEVATEVEDDDIEGNDLPHLFLAFVRDGKDSSKFEIYIINDCNYHLLYVLSKKQENSMKQISTGFLEANTKMLVSECGYDEIATMEQLYFQGIFYKNKEFVLQQNVSVDIPINPVKFYKPGVFVVNDFFDEDAYVIDFYDASKIKEAEEKELLRQVDVAQIQEALLSKKEEKVEKPKKQDKEESIREIDLHINELVDDSSLMSAGEMLDVQMKTFETELSKAVSEGLEKIVFIHGVGSGVLKTKIRGCLERDYPQFSYQDASFQKYKFGATLVYLKKGRR